MREWITITDKDWGGTPIREVACSRCGLSVLLPKPYRDQHPEAEGEAVEDHNHCKEREA